MDDEVGSWVGERNWRALYTADRRVLVCVNSRALSGDENVVSHPDNFASAKVECRSI